MRGRRGVVRKSALWVQREFLEAADILAEHYNSTIGIVAEAALLRLIDPMPDCPAKQLALAKVATARRHSEDPPPSQQLSPAPLHGGNGKRRSTSPGI